MPITISPVLPPLSKISHFILSLFLFSHSASNWSWGFFLIFCHFFHPQRLIKVGDNLISEIYFGGNIFFSSPFLSQLVLGLWDQSCRKHFPQPRFIQLLYHKFYLRFRAKARESLKKKKKDCPLFNAPLLVFLFFFFPWSFLSFLGPRLQHMEIPRLGV